MYVTGTATCTLPMHTTRYTYRWGERAAAREAFPTLGGRGSLQLLAKAEKVSREADEAELRAHGSSNKDDPDARMEHALALSLAQERREAANSAAAAAAAALESEAAEAKAKSAPPRSVLTAAKEPAAPAVQEKSAGAGWKSLKGAWHMVHGTWRMAHGVYSA